MQAIKNYFRDLVKEEDGMEFLQVAIIVAFVALLITVIALLFNAIKNKIEGAAEAVNEDVQLGTTAAPSKKN